MRDTGPHNPKTSSLAEGAPIQAVFSRRESVGKAIQDLMAQARFSIEAALHRFNSRRLAAAPAVASERGLRVRLVLDQTKFLSSASEQKLVARHGFDFRLCSGARGGETKMHHKFLLLDRVAVVTGSYNWTLASETQNHENVVIVRGAELAAHYAEEFDALWESAGEDRDRPRAIREAAFLRNDERP